MGRILSYKHGKGSVEKVDPKLWDIVQKAISVVPYDAVIRSGAERGKGDKGNHSGGYAVDVTLVDPRTGEIIPDTGKKGGAASARIYEQYAQAARVYQQETYPELNDTFRWGGGFRQGYPFDLMHLDITPNRGGSMAYYDWDTGFNSAAFRDMPGLKGQVSGGLGGAEGARRVAQIKQSLAGSGGLLPPQNIPDVASATDVAPTPARMSAALRASRATPLEMAWLPNVGAATTTPADLPEQAVYDRERQSYMPQDVFVEKNTKYGPAPRASNPIDPRVSLTTTTGTGTVQGSGVQPAIGNLAFGSSGGSNLSVTGNDPKASPPLAAPGAGMTAEQMAAIRAVPGATPQTSAPGAGLTPEQRAAMSALPNTPGVIKTADGIAGTVQLPRDVRPASVGSPRDDIGMMPNVDELSQFRGTPALQAAPVPATQSAALAARRGSAAPVPATMSPALAQRRMAPALQAPVPATQSAALQARRSTPTQTAMTAPVPAARTNLDAIRAQYGAKVGVSMTGNIFVPDPSTMTGYRILGKVGQQQAPAAPAALTASGGGGGGGGQSWFDTVKSGGTYG